MGSSPSLPPGALDSALKVDGHLLLLADDGTLAVYRRNGTAMLRLPFAEDPPKEVAWHPRNPKAFCTLHSACVRRGRPGARGAKRWKPFQVEKTEKTYKTPTPPYPSVPTLATLPHLFKGLRRARRCRHGRQPPQTAGR